MRDYLFLETILFVKRYHYSYEKTDCAFMLFLNMSFGSVLNVMYIAVLISVFDSKM